MYCPINLYFPSSLTLNLEGISIKVDRSAAIASRSIGERPHPVSIMEWMPLKTMQESFPLLKAYAQGFKEGVQMSHGRLKVLTKVWIFEVFVTVGRFFCPSLYG